MFILSNLALKVMFDLSRVIDSEINRSHREIHRAPIILLKFNSRMTHAERESLIASRLSRDTSPIIRNNRYDMRNNIPLHNSACKTETCIPDAKVKSPSSYIFRRGCAAIKPFSPYQSTENLNPIARGIAVAAYWS